MAEYPPDDTTWNPPHAPRKCFRTVRPGPTGLEAPQSLKTTAQRRIASRSNIHTPETSQRQPQPTQDESPDLNMFAGGMAPMFQFLKEMEAARQQDREKITQLVELVVRLAEREHERQGNALQQAQQAQESLAREHAKQMQTVRREFAQEVEALKAGMKALADRMETQPSKMDMSPNKSPSHGDIAHIPPNNQHSNLRRLSTNTTHNSISAKLRVFSTVELLEQILSYVPMYELLHSQRVCRTWRAIITESPALQQALFFRPLHSNSVRSDSWLLSALERRRPNVFNPLLQEVFEEWFQYSGYFGPSRTRTEDEYVASVPMKRDKPEIFTRREASWRRMLYCHPVDKPQGTFVCYKENRSTRPYGYVHVSTTDTMGKVYDLINFLGGENGEDDLRWLFFLQPGSQAKPRFGEKAEMLVKEEWSQRQQWYERNGRHERSRADWVHQGSSRDIIDFRRP
ncbi:F-box domain-containing protein [Paraphaeosphaeria sporulosa]